MSDEPKKYLQDIINSIELIEGFVEDTPDFSLIKMIKKLRVQLKDNLQLSGKPLIKYRKNEGVKELTHSKQIINFRNRLVHSYDNIDDTIVLVNCNQAS